MKNVMVPRADPLEIKDQEVKNDLRKLERMARKLLVIG